jgi:hypothetical protein
MSAPIAVSATAGSVILPFTSSISILVLAAVPVGMWAKASISPLSELAGEAQPRSSTYPQAFLVTLPQRSIAETLVLALLIVEAEPIADAGPGVGGGHAAPDRVCGDPMFGKVKPVSEWGDMGVGSSPVDLQSDPVCGIGCAPLRQSRRNDRKAFAVERADRRDQSEDETYCGE